MKTNTVIAALLMGAALFMFGCKQQTATQVAAQQGEWVEINDTTHLPNIRMGGDVYGTWEPFTGLAVRDTLEFLALATMIDTSTKSQKEYYHKHPPVLPTTPDFSQYSMVGLRYLCTIDDSIRSTLLINDSQKQYKFSVQNISNPNIPKRFALAQSQNWLLVPRLKQGYTVVFDTTTSGMGM